MSNQNIKNWIPEIMYEDDENGMTSHIPFIMVPNNQIMPKILFIFESRETGEYEPGIDGEHVPILEMELHQYADMALLKERLSLIDYNKVRIALGLEDYNTALEKGKKISDNVIKKIEN